MRRGELNTDIKNCFTDVDEETLDPLAKKSNYFERCLDGREAYVFRINQKEFKQM